MDPGLLLLKGKGIGLVWGDYLQEEYSRIEVSNIQGGGRYILDAKWFGRNPNRLGQYILHLKRVWIPKPLQRQYRSCGARISNQPAGRIEDSIVADFARPHSFQKQLISSRIGIEVNVRQVTIPPHIHCDHLVVSEHPIEIHLPEAIVIDPGKRHLSY